MHGQTQHPPALSPLPGAKDFQPSVRDQLEPIAPPTPPKATHGNGPSRTKRSIPSNNNMVMGPQWVWGGSRRRGCRGRQSLSGTTIRSLGRGEGFDAKLAGQGNTVERLLVQVPLGNARTVLLIHSLRREYLDHFVPGWAEASRTPSVRSLRTPLLERPHQGLTNRLLRDLRKTRHYSTRDQDDMVCRVRLGALRTPTGGLKRGGTEYLYPVAGRLQAIASSRISFCVRRDVEL